MNTIAQPTGPAVMWSAEFIDNAEWTKKNQVPPPTFCLKIGPRNSFPLNNWLPTSAPLIPLVLLGVVAWLHQKLVYLSRALDVYCSTFTECSEWDNLTLAHTHTFSHRHSFTHWFRGRHSMHPGDTLALLLDLLVLTLTPQSAQLGWPTRWMRGWTALKEKRLRRQKDQPEQLESAPIGDVLICQVNRQKKGEIKIVLSGAKSQAQKSKWTDWTLITCGWAHWLHRAEEEEDPQI